MPEPEIEPIPSTVGEEAVAKVKARMAQEGEDWQGALTALVNSGEI